MEYKHFDAIILDLSNRYDNAKISSIISFDAYVMAYFEAYGKDKK